MMTVMSYVDLSNPDMVFPDEPAFYVLLLILLIN
jgi:hypothetical protein